jgi:L-rhamnose 1-dehydrogenase
MQLLDGKVLVVTGGSRGIGAAICRAAANHGARVALLHHRDAEQADSVLSAIRSAGGEAIGIDGDIADPETSGRLVSETVATFGRIDALASNAGICPFHSFLDLPADMLRRTMEVNLHGAFYIVQAAAKRMKDQGSGGAIVATSSISALVGGGMQTHYTPTKAGVHSLMQSVAIVLGPHRIRCNSVMPGAILTDLNRDDLERPGKREYFEWRIPLGRIGEPA